MLTIRRGDCGRCGLCCIDTAADTEKAMGLVTVVPGYCVYFRWLPDGKGDCVGRETAFYKLGCNVFPQHPGQIADKPECTFEFVELS